MDEDLEYECTECGTYFPVGTKKCPSCGTEFDWEGDEGETIDEILEEVAPESIDTEEVTKEEVEKPSEGPVEEEYETAKEEETEVLEEAPEEKVPEELEEISHKEILEEVPPIALKKPRLYAGLFSVVGLAFIVLTVAALVATILALRWDTWINGAAEESIGDRQALFVYLGVAGTVVCAIVSFVDVLRNRKGKRG